MTSETHLAVIYEFRAQAICVLCDIEHHPRTELDPQCQVLLTHLQETNEGLDHDVNHT